MLMIFRKRISRATIGRRERHWRRQPQLQIQKKIIRGIIHNEQIAEPFHTEQEYYKELIACVRLFLEDNPEQDKMKARAILLQSREEPEEPSEAVE